VIISFEIARRGIEFRDPARAKWVDGWDTVGASLIETCRRVERAAELRNQMSVSPIRSRVILYFETHLSGPITRLNDSAALTQS